MEENEAFLKYLIDEEIYIIEDKSHIDQGTDLNRIDDKSISESPVQGSVHTPDVKIQTKGSEGTGKKLDTNRSGDSDVSAGFSKSIDKEETTEVISSEDVSKTSGAGDAKAGHDTPEVSQSGIKEESADIGSKEDDKPGRKYRDTTILLLDYEDQASMPPGHKDLLTRILQSVNLDLESVELVFQNEFDKLDVKSFLNCPVISFLQFIPRHISALFVTDKYMINIINGNQFVACNTLHDLDQDRTLKKKLWEQLKLIYGI